MFVGTTKNLHKMFQDINNLHPNIKFTMSHSHTSNNNENISESCDCLKAEAVPFLDTLCTIGEGKVVLDLYTESLVWGSCEMFR